MQLALIVGSIALGSAVLIGILGYLIDKGGDEETPEPKHYKTEGSRG
jgi:hypothetical protein